MRKSILKNLICSLALTVCAFGGAATVNTLFASADESSPVTSESVATVDFNDAVLTQESGAGIRYASSLSEMEESGLRYEIKMDADTYNGLKANYGVNVTFGVFIAPRDYHEHPTYTGRTYVNDVANITGGSAIYGWKDGGLAADGEKKRVVGGPIEILNIQTNHLTLKDDGYYHFYASITNVKLANYSREFVGFGYIKLKTAEYAITETGSGNATVYREIGAEYKFATATDNARSVAWVANKLLTTGAYKLPTPDGATAEEVAAIETENAARREVLYSGYLKKSVMTIEFQSGQKIQIGQITKTDSVSTY